jgi:hypothetical protein
LWESCGFSIGFDDNWSHAGCGGLALVGDALRRSR